MEENKIIDFLTKQWMKLLLGVLTLASFGYFIERTSKAKHSQEKQDLHLVNQVVESFYKGEFLPDESIEIAENVLKHHPELHPKLDPLLALTFLSRLETAKGVKYAQFLLKRMEEKSPSLHKDYGYTTLLIAQGKYPEAYATALALSQKVQGLASHQLLDGMNTLRLVFLAGLLNKPLEQKAHWTALNNHPAYPSINALFTAGNLTLTDYITARNNVE